MDDPEKPSRPLPPPRAKITPLRVLLVAIGTTGDVYPFLGLGAALRARGHHITMATHAHFSHAVSSHDFEFLELGTQAQYDAMIRDPGLWHPNTGLKVLAQQCLHEATETVFNLIEQHYRPGETVVVTSGLAFGARVAQDLYGIPLATVLLQPYCLRSISRAPILRAGLQSINAMPRLARRLIFRLADAWADRIVAAPINRLRTRYALPPVHRVFANWWYAPDLVLGLFPSWFAPPQPDWPPQTQLTHFVNYDHATLAQLPAEAERFLDAGEPPIVFAPGSAMMHAQSFFEQSLAACRRLKQRGILLTPYPHQLPTSLPEHVRHFDYLPFSQLLPRCAAIVHHGGIGTLAQALAAAVPQVICPRAWDQFDNAARLEALGIARSLHARRYRARAVAQTLSDLMQSQQVAAACRDYAARCQGPSPAMAACEWVEALAEQMLPSAPPC